MSTSTAVLSRMSAAPQNTAPTEGLSLAELLDVLDVRDDADSPALLLENDRNEVRGMGLCRRKQEWTGTAAIWGAGAQGTWRAVLSSRLLVVVRGTRGAEMS